MGIACYALQCRIQVVRYTLKKQIFMDHYGELITHQIMLNGDE